MVGVLVHRGPKEGFMEWTWKIGLKGSGFRGLGLRV